MTVIRALVDSLWWYYCMDVAGEKFMRPGLDTAHVFETVHLADMELYWIKDTRAFKDYTLDLYTFKPAQ